MHGALLFSPLLRHRAHTLTDAVLTFGLLILAACDGGGDGLAPDPRVSAAGAGDGHDHAPASDKRRSPQACASLGQGGYGERRESGAVVASRNESPVIGRLLVLRPEPFADAQRFPQAP